MAEARPTIDFSNFSHITSDSKRPWWGKDHNLRLPTKGASLIKEEENDKSYMPFNTFNHVTSFDSAQSILKENNLVHRQVADNSIVNLEEYSHHPLWSKKVLWFGPGDYSDNSPVERHGNVKFTMKSIKDQGGMIYEGVKFYFVEVIDYFCESACRILVTPHKYPELRVYDPYTKGGPWHIDEAGDHFHLTKISKDCDFKTQNNTLEIMREENNTQALIKNLTVSYVECNKPRKVQNETIKTYDLKYLEPCLRKLVDDSEDFTWKENKLLKKENKPFKDDKVDFLTYLLNPNSESESD